MNECEYFNKIFLILIVAHADPFARAGAGAAALENVYSSIERRAADFMHNCMRGAVGDNGAQFLSGNFPPTYAHNMESFISFTFRLIFAFDARHFVLFMRRKLIRQTLKWDALCMRMDDLMPNASLILYI